MLGLRILLRVSGGHDGVLRALNVANGKAVLQICPVPRDSKAQCSSDMAMKIQFSMHLTSACVMDHRSCAATQFGV